jgi:O-antigen ligase
MTTDRKDNLTKWKPGRLFYFGLAFVLLATWIPFIPGWYTFIHMWRVELAASIFLLATLGYLALNSSRISLPVSLSKNELWLIVFPIIAFIVWSGISVFWAPSWKSAVHHTLVWSEYLAFYLLIRYLVDNDDNVGRLLKTTAIVLVLFAIPAVIEYLALTVFGGDTFLRARFAKYGEQIVTLLPLLLIAVTRSSGRKFYLGLASVATLWLLVYCTAGRINLLLFAGVIVVIATLIFGLSRFQRYRLRFAACVLVIFTVPVPLYLFSFAMGAPEVPIISRFSDSGGTAYSNDFRKLMNSVSVEMISSHPLQGVGADNYGMQFNNFRQQYSERNPADPNLVYGEMGIVGQAHNEFLQIAAELGLVGSAIFLWFLAGIILIGFKALRGLKKNSLYPIAAVIGLGMFLASSLVSSYSFRLIQNGFVFFIVLAIASKTLLKGDAEPRERAEPARTQRLLRPAFAIGMVACSLLAGYSILRVTSVILTTKADHTQDLNEALALYRYGMALDDENPDVRSSMGMRLFQEERFSDAIPYLTESIRIGCAQSVNYSYLASAQTLAGNNEAAEKTMAAAAVLYPRSTFVLTRHAALLHANGKSAESAAELERARRLDIRAANTWWILINDGSQAASDLAFRSNNYIAVMDLQPRRSIYAVLDERDVRFPEQRSPFRRR